MPATTVTDPPPAAVDDANAIRADLRAILDLFTSELREIAFPGVDAAVLRKHADEVKARARDLERARQALDAARAALDERTQSLAALASRALAYARIYAADQPALAARLAALDSTPTAAPPPAPDRGDRGDRPRRGRPRKVDRPQLPLENGDGVDAEIASAH
jgi:hypothetical protein